MPDIIRISGTQEVLTAIPRPMDQNAAYVYLMSLPARSGRVTQKQVLDVMAGWLGGVVQSVEWGNLRFPHCLALKTRVMEAGYSPASARKFMAALRGTLRAAWKLGQINAEDLAKATDLGKIGGVSLPAGRYVQDDELAKLFEACLKDRSPNGAKDAAIIAILVGCGLRREEVTHLDLDDYKPVEGTLIVHGKRDKDRIAYVVDGTQEALEDWLKVRGAQPGPLFLAVNKTHKVRQDHRLSSQAIYNMIAKRVKDAGLEHFSPHSLRRSFVTNLLDAGVDIATTSHLAGHENITTTALYDRRGDRAQKDGARLLHIPYKRA